MRICQAVLRSRASICLYRPRGRWASAIKYGLLIPHIYVYTFTRIPHSLNKYSLGANRMQGSGPGSEASKMSKVMMANLSLSSLEMSVMGNSSRHLITSTACTVPGVFYPLSHLILSAALQGIVMIRGGDSKWRREQGFELSSAPGASTLSCYL